MQRRTVGRYEQRVRKTTGVSGFIDLHWAGVPIAEHKSRGRSVDAAESQADGYIASLQLLDPACGCGNFLVIAYRELRRIKTEIPRRVHTGSGGRVQRVTDIGTFCQVDVSQLDGIELDERPARIAEVVLWLVSHQMNRVLSDTFGTYFARLPLTTPPNIRHGNAQEIDWSEVLPAERCSYVFGNPPFVGSKYQSAEQKRQMRTMCDAIRGAGTLDYVAAWYVLCPPHIRLGKARPVGRLMCMWSSSDWAATPRPRGGCTTTRPTPNARRSPRWRTSART